MFLRSRTRDAARRPAAPGFARRRTSRWLLTVALISAAAAPGAAADLDPLTWRRGSGRRLAAFSAERRVRLEPVTLREIGSAGHAAAVPMGRWSGAGVDVAVATVNTSIARTLPSVWRLRVPADEPLGALDVSLEVEGGNGRPGCLSHEDDDGSSIRVTAQPTAPQLASYDGDSALVEGGVVLIMDISDVRTAGRYRGTVTVTVNRF